MQSDHGDLGPTKLSIPLSQMRNRVGFSFSAHSLNITFVFSMLFLEFSSKSISQYHQKSWLFTFSSKENFVFNPADF